MKKTKNFKPIDIVLTAISILIACIFLTPIVWSLACSLKTEGMKITSALDWFAPPYTFENYPSVILGSSVSTWLINSMFNASMSVILTILVTSLAAYPIAKLEFKGKSWLFLFFTVGLIVPGEATIVPLFIITNQLGLLDSYAGMILPSVAVSLNLIIISSFFKGIPNEMIEAAKIDGANHWIIYFRVVMPLAKTVLVTVSIFAFMASWNNYLWPLLCAINDSMFTLPVGIPTFAGTYTVDYVRPMTANMIASIPAIILYLIFEKRIVKGVTLSGIKG
jgi:multiple sugar transport system permease protein